MVVEIVEKTENGIKIHGLRHMDGRKKATKDEIKRIEELKSGNNENEIVIHEGNDCKYIEVKGEWINNRLGVEAEIYLDGKFNDCEMYTVYNDRSVCNSQGHEVAHDFITDDIADKIGF